MSKKFIQVYPVEKDILKTFNVPAPSRIFIPEWYKNIPNFTNKDSRLKIKFGSALNSTVKRCSPFLDALSAGYMISLPVDIQVYWDGDIPIIDHRSVMEITSDHSLEQKSYFPTPEGYYDQVQKWNNYLSFNLPKGYSLWCTHPSNRYDLPFITLNGFVDSDSYNLPIQFPFYLKNKWEGTIEAGTPIAQIFPVKRDSWEINLLNSDPKETEKRIFKYFSTIERSYKKNHWSKKEYN